MKPNILINKTTKELISAGYCDFMTHSDLNIYEQIEIDEMPSIEGRENINYYKWDGTQIIRKTQEEIDVMPENIKEANIKGLITKIKDTNLTIADRIKAIVEYHAMRL